MTTQPDALRLADALDAYCTPQDVAEQAAAELRRFHTQRAALLEALKNIERSTYDAGTAALVRVAIAKAEENA